MKVAILAGGSGTRLAEETDVKPKPMVEIGGRPILWHIMMQYTHYGFNDFVIALGYKGEYIKKFMVDFFKLNSDLTVNLHNGEVIVRRPQAPNMTADLVDTGMNTQTGGRIKRLRSYIGDQTFMLTWGDGVSNINLHELLAFHRAHGKLATLSAVRPPARFGHLELNGPRVEEFSEKPQTREGWINGAFFVLEPKVFDYIDDDATQFERSPLERLARDGQLMAFRHEGFWQCMDTIRDKRLLESLWDKGAAPWAVWETPSPKAVL
jgi:glucose-1-phosphate cytidylyltransferase